MGTSLNTSGTYKSMKYGWFHRDWTHFSAGLLFLNNGLQVKDSVETKNNKTKYSQTFGGHFNYKIKKLVIMSNLYYQFGHDVDENDLSAYLFALESNYQFSGRVNTTLGAEPISGNNNGTPSDGNNNAFTPFYGTNHKFNGLMDYFFVGNHQNDVGLWDVYGKNNVIIRSNSIFVIAAHYFAAAADISGTDSKQLGMELVKGNADGNTNNWAWLMITLTPILFENEK